MEWPDRLTMNAWTGDKGTTAVSGRLAEGAVPWTLKEPVEYKRYLLPMPVADPNDWRDPRVGWGLVLRDRPGRSQSDLASGADAPAPIRKLLEARPAAPVLRYSLQTADPLGFLRDYKNRQDLDIAGSPQGTAPGEIPRYLLICGSPEEIPWKLQYILNTNRCVGRLDLDQDGLERYVGALLSNWSGPGADPLSAVVWATNYGGGDITALMDDTIARPLAAKFAADKDLKSKFLDGQQATGDALVRTLAEAKPGLVVTSSHGLTGPTDRPEKMKAGLGLPVDSGYRPLDLAALRQSWKPAGAVWYAHACCSAGCDARSRFEGLFDSGSDIARTLAAVAGLGALVAPLPKALLGAQEPLRAFVGHVEPTFDWTLRQPLSGQYITAPIQAALYDGLYNRQPVGNAFRDWYERIGPLLYERDAALNDFNKGENSQNRLLYCLLTARDVGASVILGDPTVLLPVPKVA